MLVFSVPGDKSITHRAFLFSALAKGKSKVITNALGRDNFASLRAVKSLGVRVSGYLTEELYLVAKEEGFNEFEKSNGDDCLIIIESDGLSSFSAPVGAIDCGNSGTTARLLCGILSACPFKTMLVGDHSLSKRPFNRVSEPLMEMGATFSSTMLPIEIQGTNALKGIDYVSPKASAQVKSAILLAGLFAEGPVRVSEPTQSRDHTERMFELMGQNVNEQEQNGRWAVALENKSELNPIDIVVPGDFSSASFFIVLGVLSAKNKIQLKNISLNKTRLGLYDVLERMGADIALVYSSKAKGELVGDIFIQKSLELKATEISSVDVVRAIDEIPILCVAAVFSRGLTKIRGAKELRVKESDRITLMAEMLRAVGINVTEYEDGLDIDGRPELLFSKEKISKPEAIRGSGDHRIIMCWAVLSYLINLEVGREEVQTVETSFPGFFQLLEAFKKENL